ncbi:MAG TPA: trypsin-like peptidase domain-containing protein [Usitatibacteraceae bacterium]|nr:trypsin-like peptidase domain-containing protein [Usitatibacteraceae bacterium]
MRRLWLVFAEFVTLTLAVVFVVTLIRPDWNPWRRNVVEIREAGPLGALLPAATSGAVRSSYADAARKAIPSVVNISASRDARRERGNPLANDPFLRRFLGESDEFGEDSQRPTEGLGSGVVISVDDSGSYILTNDHVVGGFSKIDVLLGDGRSLPAKLVGTDPETDLAVLRVAGKGLTPITLGQSDRAQVGDVVLAIGDPFGVGQTVTMGIISALGRNRLGVNRYENFIQTDAAINPGNSGGALVDLSGNLIGINSVIYSRTGGSLGIGFAIPVSMAKGVMEQIIAEGAVTRGFIGIAPQDVTPDLADSLKLKAARGALVAQVTRGGPADKGGMKPGDVIVGIEGRPIQDSVTAMAAIAALKPGSNAKFTVTRNQQDVDVIVNVARRPAPPRLRRE